MVIIMMTERLFALPISQAWHLTAQLSQRIARSQEGQSLVLSANGSVLAVGSLSPHIPHNKAGSIHIYDYIDSNWHHNATLSQKTPSNMYEGCSIALSADGTTLAASGWGDHNDGEVYIYKKTAGIWMHVATLSQLEPGSVEGCSVALSADGKVLAAGAWGYKHETGAVQIYREIDNEWKHEATVTQNNARSQEGFKVALSADGSTLAAISSGVRLVAVHIYNYSSNQWSHQATLKPREVTDCLDSIALSADGNTVAMGDPCLFNDAGGVFVYHRSGAQWSLEAIVSQSHENSKEGAGVVLSADGNTLITAANFYKNGGAIHIYKKFGSLWQYQETISRQGASGSYEALALSLSADKNILAIGTPYDNSIAGGILIYVNDRTFINS